MFFITGSRLGFHRIRTVDSVKEMLGGHVFWGADCALLSSESSFMCVMTKRAVEGP
jgi:hypothetical protein